MDFLHLSADEGILPGNPYLDYCSLFAEQHHPGARPHHQRIRNEMGRMDFDSCTALLDPGHLVHLK
ncbi:MAG: hypothetical protein RLZZ557_663, partial [Bacteroidota bacterium]